MQTFYYTTGEGHTLEEIMQNAPFENISGDATRAYKTAEQAENFIPSEFMLDYLNKHKATPGECYVIRITPLRENTSKYPYKRTDLEKKYYLKYNTFYQIYDPDTLQILSEAAKTQVDARREIRRIYSEGYIGKAVCRKVKLAKGSEIFTAKYTPSNNSQEGKYIIFGFTNLD